MVFVNFYEHTCNDNSEETCYSVEGSYVPHWRLEETEMKGFSLPIHEFEKWISESLEVYLAFSSVGTRDVNEMCEEDYVRGP